MNASRDDFRSQKLGEWATRYQSRLIMSIYQKTRNQADAQEIAQEAMTKALEKCDTEIFSKEKELTNWIFAAAKNHFIDRKRRKSSKDTTDTTLVSATAASPGDTPEYLEILSEEWAIFHDCTKRLDDLERKVLAYRLDGASHKEIVELANLGTPNHSEKALSRARRKLSNCMEASRS